MYVRVVWETEKTNGVNQSKPLLFKDGVALVKRLTDKNRGQGRFYSVTMYSMGGARLRAASSSIDYVLMNMKAFRETGEGYCPELKTAFPLFKGTPPPNHPYPNAFEKKI